MVDNSLLEQYLDALLKGDRKLCRSLIEETLQTGTLANSVYSEIVWPMMVEIDNLVRTDRISVVQEHMANRINRAIIDQLQNKLPRKANKDTKIVVWCASLEIHELGAQMTADLFESDGWDVRFLGGGLTNDDILEFINDYAPDVLLIYGTGPKQAPDIRKLIDTIKGVNAYPDMKIMVSGGLFNRAEGLWEEIGADMFAETAVEAVQIASQTEPPEPAVRTINRRKRTKRKAVNETTETPEI